jgi:hypothetical protein
MTTPVPAAVPVSGPQASLGEGPASALAIGKLVKDILAVLASDKAKGVTSSQELSDLLAAGLPDAMLIVGQLSQVSADFSLSPILFSKALLCPILDGVHSLTGK